MDVNPDIMTREKLFDLLNHNRPELVEIARGQQMLGRDEVGGVSDNDLLLWIKTLSEDELNELE